MADLRLARRTASVIPLRVFSGLVHAVEPQTGKSPANVALLTRSGKTGRPELFRDVRDSRDVPLCDVRELCTSRANDHARPLAVRCGKLGANTIRRSVGENEAVATEAENFGGKNSGAPSSPAWSAKLSERAKHDGEDGENTPRSESTGIQTPRNDARDMSKGPSAESGDPWRSRALLVSTHLSRDGRRECRAIPFQGAARRLRFTGALVRSIRTCGTDGVQVGVWKAAARPVTIHPTPCVIEERGSRPFRTVSRAAASRRRATTSTSTVVVKPALLRSGGVAPRRAHNAQTACSTQASATSAFPVFVARVRASNDRAPATPAMAGGPDHQLEVA
jgi:hypothetical protein